MGTRQALQAFLPLFKGIVSTLKTLRNFDIRHSVFNIWKRELKSRRPGGNIHNHPNRAVAIERFSIHGN
jgi:hypothetical protein